MGTPREIYYSYLSENAIRHSQQRDAIFSIFVNSQKHLTLVEIYKLTKIKLPHIGYTTVYRAMKVICDAGLALEVDLGDGIKRFENNYGRSHHDHLICIKCKRCIEVVNPKIERMQDKMAKEYNFTPLRHNLQIFGFCRDCGKR